MTRVSWSGVPLEVRGAIEPLLMRWLHIVPGWCAEINMQYEDAPEDGGSLRTHVRPECRDTLFQVCPWWLKADPETRELHVIHELVHIGFGPLVNFAREAIRDTTEEGSTARRVLERQCVSTFEGCVEDLTRAFYACAPRREVAG